jgi:hypothetical protein
VTRQWVPQFLRTCAIVQFPLHMLPRPACFKPQPKVDGLFQEKLASYLHLCIPPPLPWVLRVNQRISLFDRYQGPHIFILRPRAGRASLHAISVRQTKLNRPPGGTISSRGQRGRMGSLRQCHSCTQRSIYSNITLNLLSLSPASVLALAICLAGHLSIAVV